MFLVTAMFSRFFRFLLKLRSLVLITLTERGWGAVSVPSSNMFLPQTWRKEQTQRWVSLWVSEIFKEWVFFINPLFVERTKCPTALLVKTPTLLLGPIFTIGQMESHFVLLVKSYASNIAWKGLCWTFSYALWRHSGMATAFGIF